MSSDVTDQLFNKLNETELPIGIQLDCANFPTIEELIMNKEEQTPEGLQDEIVGHLENLKKMCGHYFSNDESGEQDWIRFSFLFNLDTMDDSNMQKDDLIDSKRALLKQSFQSQTVDEFQFAQLGNKIQSIQ